ncbi:MAG: putative DNA binding domain-containing protein [Synergistaceae bacterium]|jgi:ATP-dependent DNA helicase RecG|nr:putative DNA binding domain-containing protein [Synergistaceae bacterium]
MKTLNQMLIAEATEYDFKSEPELKKPKSWLKTVSAYANGIGGSIYFGVSNDGHVLGLADVQSKAEEISELIKTRIEPATTFLLEPLTIEDKDILRLEIKSGQSTPYYYSGDGNKLAYIRLGNESAPAPSHILNELILKGSNQSFDVLESKYAFRDYSFTLFEATYKQKTRNSVESPRDYVSFGLLCENGQLTFAGALMADQCPVYQSRVFCTRWNGLSKGSIFIDAIDDEEYNGNIIVR